MTRYTVPKSALGAAIEPGLYAVEASDLRLPPGTFPDHLEAVGEEGYGLSLSFVAIKVARTLGVDDSETRLGRWTDRDGDLAAQDYRSIGGGYVLRIIND